MASTNPSVIAPPPAVGPATAVDHAYELWLWLDERVMGFPTAARASHGARTLDASLEVLDLLLRASYAPRGGDLRAQCLTLANQRVALLRYLLRGARDLRRLSIDQHTFALEHIDALGRMIGGWLRAS